MWNIFSNGGLHISENKHRTNYKKIVNFDTPKQVFIPLSQHIGGICKPIVEIGQRVKKGQKIGQSDKFISASLHSSISGKIVSIQNIPHPTLGESLGIIIENDGKDELDSTILRYPRNIDEISSEEIREMVKEAGIVGMGGAGFPTHVKLTPPESKKLDSFVLNGAECEPYLTSDHRIMVEFPEEILKGMKIIMKTLNIEKGYIAIEKNKPDAIHAMRHALCAMGYEISPKPKAQSPKPGFQLSMIVLNTKYPQGAEKQLIKKILKREVLPKGLPFDVGALVDNVATCQAVYEAVAYRKTLYERVITLTGSIVKNPQNLKVRLGTTLNELINYIGGLTQEPALIIAGGPMMGVTLYTLDTPITKPTSGIVVFSKQELKFPMENPCIKCAQCVDTCPVRLLPAQLGKLAKKQRWQDMEQYYIFDCIECGLCEYICPSKIPLVQLIRLGKKLCEIQKN